MAPSVFECSSVRAIISADESVVTTWPCDRNCSVLGTAFGYSLSISVFLPLVTLLNNLSPYRGLVRPRFLVNMVIACLVCLTLHVCTVLNVFSRVVVLVFTVFFEIIRRLVRVVRMVTLAASWCLHLPMLCEFMTLMGRG